MVVTPSQHLRRDVVRRTNHCCHHLTRLKPFRVGKTTELHNVTFERSLVHQQHILWLKVTMTDTLIVHVTSSRYELVHDRRSARFCETALIYDQPEKLTPQAQIH